MVSLAIAGHLFSFLILRSAKHVSKDLILRMRAQRASRRIGSVPPSFETVAALPPQDEEW
jgi:hypothetical protein